MSCFLGIDAGTSGIKTIVMDKNGEILGSGYFECDVVNPYPGWAEQDPLMWWDTCCKSIKQAVKNSNCAGDIKSISFSGQMQGCTMIDKDYNPIDNCIIWLDQRANKEVEDISKIISKKEAIEATANACLNSFWAPKLLWYKKHYPNKFEKIYKVMFTKDYLRFRMTGEIATEVSDASLTFLMDVAKRKWNYELIDKLDIPRNIIPETLGESQDVLGCLKKDIAEDWGLRTGIPVVAGGGDQPAGGVGTGVIRSGIIGATIGTSGVVFGCTDRPLIDDKDRAIYTMAHSVPDKWCFLGLVLTAGASLKWVRDIMLAEKKSEYERKGKDIYEFMTGLAERTAVGSEGLLFLPYLNGEKTPINNADARGLFFGLSQRHDMGDICRSVMEGVTFAMHDTIMMCREFGIKVNEVRANGGGAKSQLWRQIQADVYKANIITTNIDEGPAAGAAIMAAVGAGEFSSIEEACDSILKVVSVTEPIVENVKRYEESYYIYKELYSSLKELYAKNAKIVNMYL